MSVEVIVEDPAWRELGLDSLAQRAFEATLRHLNLSKGEWEAVVLGCNDARIEELNERFRDKPRATNVLSWPTAERGAAFAGEIPEAPDPHDPELGDIAIAYETCAREAHDQARSLADHATHLLVHGTLHLLGYDHERAPDATLMERVEVEILATLGVADPYS